MKQKITLEIAPDLCDTGTAKRLSGRFETDMHTPKHALSLRLDEKGLSLISEGQVLQGDFARMLPRIKDGRLQSELLIRASKQKGASGPLSAVDATAGLGEDSLLLAAAGFRVTLYEQNPVVYELLQDAINRASTIPELEQIITRMDVRNENSVDAMARLDFAPDVILLDPMFPERQKSGLVKKKLQMIQKLEEPCTDERTLLLSAMRARPKKLIIKRPPKGPHLAGIKPDYCISGKAVRFDCFVSPFEKIHKFE